MTWLPKKSVLVPTDFSEPSIDAARTALELVDKSEDVLVLHVLASIEHTAPAVLFGDLDDESRRQQATTHLDDFLERHQMAGVRSSVVVGNPGMKIAEVAGEEKADLIVIPSHGHHGLQRLLLGSVTERVVRHAECPVLVTRRTDHE